MIEVSEALSRITAETGCDEVNILRRPDGNLRISIRWNGVGSFVWNHEYTELEIEQARFPSIILDQFIKEAIHHHSKETGYKVGDSHD